VKSNEYWALYNGSVLWRVEKTQRGCKEVAEDATGEVWKECKKYFKVIKVTVKPVDNQAPENKEGE